MYYFTVIQNDKNIPKIKFQNLSDYLVKLVSLLYWHSTAIAILNKSEEIVKNTIAASKYIPRRPRISINVQRAKNPTSSVPTKIFYP